MSKSRRALQTIVGSLSEQLVRGWACLEAARQMDGALEGHESGGVRAFLSTIYDACVESAILAFARLTISHKDSISVVYLLNCVQQSPSAFPLAERVAVMDTVTRHRALLEDLGSLVDRVKDYRDRTIAHLDKRYVNHRDAVHSRPPVELCELEQAFVLTRALLNAYRRALDLSELEPVRLEPDRAGEWALLFQTSSDKPIEHPP